MNGPRTYVRRQPTRRALPIRSYKTTRKCHRVYHALYTYCRASTQDVTNRIIVLMKKFMDTCDADAPAPDGMRVLLCSRDTSVSSATAFFDNFDDVVEMLEPFYDRLVCVLEHSMTFRINVLTRHEVCRWSPRGHRIYRHQSSR